MTELSQTDFTKAMQAATERLWRHRKALRRCAVRIGFWPDGMVITANLAAGHALEELKAGVPPRVIPWPEVATLSQAGLIGIIDSHCAPLYRALGLKPDEENTVTAQIILGRGANQVVQIAGLTEADIGTPTVAVCGYLDGLEHMTPERAEEFAEGLKAAARLARGEAAA